jgi:tRNA pseudouridine13 synthase
MSELPYAHGGPPLVARLRATPDDFFVDEDLGFAPDGAGEHVFVRVEKRGANTDFVAKALARHAGVAPDVVGYAGMKDRHAVTRQTFSLPIPVKREIDWAALVHDEFRVLDAQRHSRKLKRGALAGNAFRIALTDVAGDRDAAARVLERIAQAGVPNYFGEQRFGRDDGNVERARAMFAGRRVQRHERSLYLSSARSRLFNDVLARRVADGDWNLARDGDVYMLDGSRSIFGPEAATPELVDRIARADVHPTGPLWGRGSLRTSGNAAALETSIADAERDLAEGLAQARLEQERRSLRLCVQRLEWKWAESSLVVAFALPAGCYATTVLRELARSDVGDAAPAMRK